MLDQTTKRQIDTARQILVGKVPDPKAQIDQITTAMIYKFMDDMDKESVEIGGKARFFADEMSQYAWVKIMDVKLSGDDRIKLYRDGIEKLKTAQNIPELFRNIFKNYYLPFYDQRTLSMFLKEINEFSYDNSENLGNAFEYLLSVLGSQGDAGQFRTPRHIIDFIVSVVDPKKNESILDPACGTAGFLISAYKHIVKTNSSNYTPEVETKDLFVTGETALETVESEISNYKGDLLTPDDKIKLTQNIAGYDLDPNMVKLALVNLYLHGFPDPKISEYDTLSSDKRWDDNYDIILANPPFMTPKGGIQPLKRFSINANRAEVLFVDYIAEHLTANGRAGIIVPEGIIFQSANAYKNLRKSLIENWGLYAVVSLPSGVFQPYSGVKTSILLLNKEFAKRTDEILFLKVEADGFDLGAQRRKIDKNDLPVCLEILDLWKRERLLEENNSKFAFAIKKEKIAEKGEYNLTGDRYRKTVDYSNAKWDFFRIGDIFESGRGRVISKVDIQQNQGIYPVYSSQTTDNGIFGYINSFDFEGEYLTWTTDGANAGKVFYRFGKFNCTNVCGTLKLKIEFMGKVNLKFVAPILDKITYKYVVKVGNPKLMNKEVERIKIPLPPLEIQEQIVTEIEQYQKVIDGAKQVVENWKPNFRIDPSWEMVELGEVFQIESGGTPDSQNIKYWNGNVKWATLVDIPDNVSIISNTNRSISEEGLKNSSAKLLPKGTVLISSRATIGRIAITDSEMATNQGFKNIIVDDRNNSLFIAYMLSTQVEKMKLMASGGTFKEISKSSISSIIIPLPPLEVQEQIVAEIESEQRAIDECKKLIEKMQKKIEAKINEVWGDSE